MAAVAIFAPLIATASAPIAAATPKTIGATMSRLLASHDMAFKTGCNACRATFCIDVQTCAHVMGMDANAASVSSAAPSMAFFTTSAVTAPSDASSRISPVPTPMYSAMVFAAIIGVCSSTLLSSSPRSVPEDKPCVSCTIAAAALWPDAPEMVICFCNCSAKATSSPVLRLPDASENAFGAIMPS